MIWIGMTVGCAIGYAFGARAAVAARRLVGDDGLARAGAVMDRYGVLGPRRVSPDSRARRIECRFRGTRPHAGRPFAWMTTLSNLGIALAYAAVGAYLDGGSVVPADLLAALALPGLAMLAGRSVAGTRGKGSRETGETTAIAPAGWRSGAKPP